jgi:hypothetical protein
MMYELKIKEKKNLLKCRMFSVGERQFFNAIKL